MTTSLSLEYALALYRLDRLPSETLPELAVSWLLAGMQSDSLALLAGESRSSDPRELADLFAAALAELDVRLPTRADAALRYRDKIAMDVVEQRCSPRDGGSRLAELDLQVEDEFPRGRFAGSGLGVAEVISLYYALDDSAWMDAKMRAIEEEKLAVDIVAACRALLGAVPQH